MMIDKTLIAICWVGIGVLRAIDQFKFKNTPTNEEYWILYMATICFMMGAYFL